MSERKAEQAVLRAAEHVVSIQTSTSADVTGHDWRTAAFRKLEKAVMRLRELKDKRRRVSIDAPADVELAEVD